ncbi:MAG: hypothetical protein M3441_01865 [Chloroflexota bacterium]|nr:hypothetical protein [Chloroflexota bacterium]
MNVNIPADPGSDPALGPVADPALGPVADPATDPGSATPEDIRFEYEQIRNEIVANIRETLQVLGGTLVFSGALMSVALSQIITNPGMRTFVFIAAGVINLLGTAQTFDRGRVVFLNASYLRVFIEAKWGAPKWETRLGTFRRIDPTHGFGSFVLHQLIIYALLAAVNTILAFYFAYFAPGQDVSELPSLLQTLPKAAFSLWLLVLVWAGVTINAQHGDYILRHENTFDPIWNEVANRVKNSWIKDSRRWQDRSDLFRAAHLPKATKWSVVALGVIAAGVWLLLAPCQWLQIAFPIVLLFPLIRWRRSVSGYQIVDKEVVVWGKSRNCHSEPLTKVKGIVDQGQATVHGNWVRLLLNTLFGATEGPFLVEVHQGTERHKARAFVTDFKEAVVLKLENEPWLVLTPADAEAFRKAIKEALEPQPPPGTTPPGTTP